MSRGSKYFHIAAEKGHMYIRLPTMTFHPRREIALKAIRKNQRKRLAKSSHAGDELAMQQLQHQHLERMNKITMNGMDKMPFSSSLGGMVFSYKKSKKEAQVASR